MEYQLTFNLTLYNGEKAQQVFKVPPDQEKIQAFINQLIGMYFGVGYIKSTEGGLLARRVNEVDVVVPSILIAQPGEMPKGGKVSLT